MIGELGSTLYRYWQRISKRADDFKGCFRTPAGENVLRHLALYTKATAPISGEREEGRRDVWLFIQKHLQLTDDELAVLFAKLTPEQRHQLWQPGATYLEE